MSAVRWSGCTGEGKKGQSEILCARHGKADFHIDYVE